MSIITREVETDIVRKRKRAKHCSLSICLESGGWGFQRNVGHFSGCMCIHTFIHTYVEAHLKCMSGMPRQYK